MAMFQKTERWASTKDNGRQSPMSPAQRRLLKKLHRKTVRKLSREVVRN